MPDPVWLPDVLRAAGLEVREYPGWRDRGHGDFGEIWGVIAHHTGSNPPSNNPGHIAQHPQLGLASQLHLSRDGVYTVCGVGIAWHAGDGSYPGLPTDDANRFTIGIEAENNGTEGWSPRQYTAYVKGVAAILRKLGHNSSRVIGHKEWAGASQGKWDPGGMDMNRFRADVARLIAGGELNEGDDDMGWLDTQIKNFKNIALSYKDVLWWMDKHTSEAREQLLGPDDGKGGFKGWKILGRSKVDPNRDNTLVEGLAEVRNDVAEIKALLEGREK
ncbi:peptidoglycan recognition protein family protein [Nocardia farcinica]|uniref:peptidoglycan recognition protein family protein n=1 Tax=Nocardia farcinica TaxID=37329 RepID=UPI00245577BB|nr:N-acetylmuramoyl-L-alanine amidase [Nocardia farcinica]